jgi:uncharacterized protein (TIGR02118 family)
MSQKNIQVIVDYPSRPGARFDWAYYLEKHIPMAANRFGARLLGAAIHRGVAGVGGEPAALVCSVHLTFASPADFEAAFGPHATEILGDIPNYTDIAPKITIAEQV